mgnify:CR=1 FL=1
MSSQIKDLFQKDMLRSIPGVVTARIDDGMEGSSMAGVLTLEQEIEEYVITHEIETSLISLLEKYNNSSRQADGNGVWISGFFGSGKSHLLKMLSVILSSHRTGNSTASEIFLRRCRSTGVSAELTGLLETVTRKFPSESILFNIDTKASIESKGQPNLIMAFFRVFFEHLGYCSSFPETGRIEYMLDQEMGRLQEFKEIFAKVCNGTDWDQRKKAGVFVGPDFNKAYQILTGCSQAESADMFKRLSEQFRPSIEDFSLMVKSYTEKKGPGFRLNFFVDEVGQFIADHTDRMLNLQTISESLRDNCGDRSWLFVTSQEDLDPLRGTLRGQQTTDFSKIQDRFSTRIKLSSKDVSEVIQKRLLEKSLPARSELEDLYQKEHNNFRTLFDFNGNTRDYPRFRSEEDFINCYPFIPYQFGLLTDCFEGLSRNRDLEGKSNSRGERSMLQVFQQVLREMDAQKLTTGSLASFDLMYEGIVSRAKSGSIRPINQAAASLDGFAVQILKALFLIKGVDTFSATADNITILMQSSFSENRRELRNRVSEALNILHEKSFVECHGGKYSFLTDKEKEIENNIRSTEVDDSAYLDKIMEIFFSRILSSGKIRDKSTNSDYPYEILMDCQSRGKRNAELMINLITPLSGDREHTRIVPQFQERNLAVLTVIPAEDQDFLPLLRIWLQTERFCRIRTGSNISDSDPMAAAIISLRLKQNNERDQELVERFREMVANGEIYILGDHMEQRNAPADPAQRVITAFLRLVTKIYYKHSLIDGMLFSESELKDREHRLLLNAPEGDPTPAEREILDQLESFRSSGRHPSVKAINDIFQKRPYHWEFPVVPCLLARLWARKLIHISGGSGRMTLPPTIAQKLLNTREQENIFLELRQQISSSQVLELQRFAGEYLKTTFTDSDPQMVAANVLQDLRERWTRLQDGIRNAGNLLRPYEISIPDPVCETASRMEETLKGCGWTGSSGQSDMEGDPLELYKLLTADFRDKLMDDWSGSAGAEKFVDFISGDRSPLQDYLRDLDFVRDTRDDLSRFSESWDKILEYLRRELTRQDQSGSGDNSGNDSSASRLSPDILSRGEKLIRDLKESLETAGGLCRSSTFYIGRSRRERSGALKHSQELMNSTVSFCRDAILRKLEGLRSNVASKKEFTDLTAAQKEEIQDLFAGQDREIRACTGKSVLWDLGRKMQELDSRFENRIWDTIAGYTRSTSNDSSALYPDGSAGTDTDIAADGTSCPAGSHTATGSRSALDTGSSDLSGSWGIFDGADASSPDSTANSMSGSMISSGGNSTGSRDGNSATRGVPAKQTVTISDVMEGLKEKRNSMFLKTPEDVESYVTHLREDLLRLIQSGDTIAIR